MSLKHKSTVIQSLKQHHLFTKLTDLQLDRVYNHCRLEKLDSGQILFSQGEPVSAFYLVLSGQIKLFRMSPDGQEKIIEFINHGDVFAEALMFDDKDNYPVSATALTDSELVALDARQFKNMLWESTDTCLLLLADMSFRLRKMVNEIDNLTLQSGTCRVVSYLIQMSEGSSEEFELNIAKNVIAARLSIKPETFSRIIKNLNHSGMISINGNKVVIHDLDGLKLKCII